MAESFNGALQVGADLPARAVARSRRRRVLDDDLRRLVQPPPSHGEITNDNSYTTPGEFEALYYRQSTTALEAVTP
jgi:hypothetical protein